MNLQNYQPSANNHQLKLKICGLTQLSQIRELLAINVDFLGFIFYEKSPRYVLNHLSLKEISEINHNGKVGVFVNENLEKVVDIIERADIQYVQLHGDEDEDFISELKYRMMDSIKIIKVIRIPSVIPRNEETQRFFNSLRSIENNIDYVLFDTDSKAFGGTGKTFDWNILNEIEIPIPYFLSGGVSKENIHQLTTINHQPFAIDINSKFEIEAGNKDLKKIKTFIRLVKV